MAILKITKPKVVNYAPEWHSDTGKLCAGMSYKQNGKLCAGMAAGVYFKTLNF